MLSYIVDLRELGWVREDDRIWYMTRPAFSLFTIGPRGFRVVQAEPLQKLLGLAEEQVRQAVQQDPAQDFVPILIGSEYLFAAAKCAWADKWVLFLRGEISEPGAGGGR